MSILDIFVSLLLKLNSKLLLNPKFYPILYL